MDSDLLEENSNAENPNQPEGKFVKAGGWLAALLLVFGFLLGSSWLSLLTLGELPEEDTRSKLYADYKPWEYALFQPVDQAIIGAIESDRGDNIDLEDPEEAPEGDWFWETPTPVPGEEETPIAPTLAATRTPAPSSTTIIPPSRTSTHTITPVPTATYTEVPATIPLPTATITPKPTKPRPPTSTNTASPTNTPGPSPTNTPTPTPSNTPTPTDACVNIGLRGLSTTSDKSRWQIRNNNSVPITIQSLTFIWPAANGQLVSIRLGSFTIWTGSAAPSSITIGPGDWTGGDLSITTNKNLVFQFETSAANTGYDMTVTFVGGCVVNATR